MSAALWRICRHIIGRLTIRDYIYQGSAGVLCWNCCVISKLIAFIHVIQGREEISTNDISSKRSVKNTLRIDSKQRLPCFSRYYGVNLEKSLAFWWLNFRVFLVAKRDAQKGAISPKQIIFQEKLNICYLTESLLIENIWSSSKVNDFIWMFICFLWKCCMLNVRHNPMLGFQYCYTNACFAMVEKHIFENLRWQCC